MACGVEVVIVDPTPGAGTWALHRLSQLEQRWSRFLPFSDITAINESQGGPVEVHPDTVRLLLSMQQGLRVTDGLFDPRPPDPGPAPRRPGLSDPASRARAAQGAPVEWGLRVDDSERRVWARPEHTLDPGGIGKGLAADLVVAELLQSGCRGALVSVGGDLAAAGDPPRGGGWEIDVEAPGADRQGTRLEIRGGGVATSTALSANPARGRAAVLHQIDPRGGGRADCGGLAAATVVGPSGWLAEVHATAALLSGSAAAEYLRSRELDGVLTSSDGRQELVLREPAGRVPGW